MNRSRRAKACPENYTLRKGYVRKYSSTLRRQGYTRIVNGKKTQVFPTSRPVHIKSRCIKSEVVTKIGPLRSGDLIKYGYQYRLSPDRRRDALKDAIKEYGPLSTFRKLDAVAKLGVHKMPAAAKVFKSDRDWVRSHYSLHNTHG